VEILGISPIIVEIREMSKRIGEQRLGNQNIGPQVINLKF